MFSTHQTAADILIRAPKPHVSLTPNEQRLIVEEFNDGDLTLDLYPEPNYPCSDSWAEIAVHAGTFLSGALLNHYATKLFNALDKFIEKKYKKIQLGICIGSTLDYRDIDRENRDEAIEAIKNALRVLEASDRSRADP